MNSIIKIKHIIKNNMAIFVTSCLFFIMMGIVGTGAMIYDITENKDDENISSGIMLAIFLGFIFFPVTLMIVAAITHIINMYKKNKYPVLYTSESDA